MSTRVKAVVTVVAAWVGASFLTASQVQLGLWMANRPPQPFTGLLLLHLIDWLPWALLVPVIVALRRRFPLKRGRLLRAIAFHLPFSLSLGAALLLLSNVIASLSEGVALSDPRFWPNYAFFLAMSLHGQVLTYWLILAVLAGVTSYNDWRSGAALNARLRSRASELRRELATARQAQAPKREYAERLAIRESGQVRYVPTTDIDWIEAADYYVEIHAGGTTHLLRETMARLEKRLDPRCFARIHRSTIVNVERVRELERLGADWEVVLRCGKRLRLSRGRRKQLQAALPQHA